MTFDFKHKLSSGFEIDVEAEVCIRTEEILLSLSFPWSDGIHLDRLLQSAFCEREAIEESAWQRALQLNSEGAA